MRGVQILSVRTEKFALNASLPAAIYPRLSDARVTDENAPVTFLAPGHPALTTPNRITEADMEG